MSAISAKIMDLDKANKNGRTYGTETMEKAIADAKFPIIGTLGMPDGASISLHRVSHTIEAITVKDGAVYAKINVLTTPAGQELDKLLAKNKIEFRDAGTGKIAEDGTVSDFTLITVSAVDAETAA